MNVPQSIQRNVQTDMGVVPAPPSTHYRDPDDPYIPKKPVRIPIAPEDEIVLATEADHYQALVRAVREESPEDRKPLNEIAALMRALTYGEMMELSAAIWNIRPDGAELTQEALPMTLHRWSTSNEP